MTQPEITVLMTVRNSYKFLEESIKSILNQTVENFILLIIDDGSDDGSENLIKSFSDQRIHYCKNDRVGYINALNIGIRNTITKYIAVFDSDDIADNNRIKKQLIFLESNPQIGLVGTSIKYFVNSINENIWTIKMPESHKEILKGLNDGKFFIHHSTVMYRTSLIKKINGYADNSYPVPDLDMFLKIGSISELANLSNISSFIRLHPGNFTVNNLRQIVTKKYFILNNKEPNKFISFQKFHIIKIYRKGIIYFLEKKYLRSGFFFFISFLLAPFRSFNYITKKMKIVV
jgi:glycosyltransferase involved in cell wall biosynthesis